MKRKIPATPERSADERSADERVAEAFALHERGELAVAEPMYRAVLEDEPDHHAALNLLAMIVTERDPGEAVALISRAIAAVPDVAWYHLNLGHAHAAAGNDDGAVAAMQASAALDRDSAIPRYDLARHHLRNDRPVDGLAALREVIALEPDHDRAQFLIASLVGGHLATAPASYVTELFDSYAPSFEAHLVNVLDYKAPAELAALVTAAGHAPDRAWQVVDLGCGSGLGGAAFRDCARHLVGSDLSRRMIEIAYERGVYDDLYVEDLTATLARSTALDLVVAADVFIYVGALEAAFAAAATALRPGGLFAFSTEHDTAEGTDGDSSERGFRLLPSRRYAHADRYIRALAERHDFTVREARATTLRVEDARPVAGMLYVLAAAAQPAQPAQPT